MTAFDTFPHTLSVSLSPPTPSTPDTSSSSPTKLPPLPSSASPVAHEPQNDADNTMTPAAAPVMPPQQQQSLPHPAQTTKPRPPAAVPRRNGVSHVQLNVVVTGGSSGIGAAIVRAFSDAGHRVLFTYLSGYPRAQRLVAETQNRTTATHLDQADVASIARFAATAARWSRECGVDILINNAALGSATVDGYVQRAASNSPRGSPTVAAAAAKQRNGLADDTPSSSVDAMLQRAAKDEALLKVNALGPLWVTDALTDLLQTATKASPKKRSTVVFISSVGGGSPAVFPEYCAADLMSKAAMTYLSKHIAAKYVRDAIDVICISPGATDTDMFRASTLSKVDDVPRFIDSLPKRRLIEPAEMADTVLWLATHSPPGLFHGAVLDASMGLAVRPGLQTETEDSR